MYVIPMNNESQTAIHMSNRSLSALNYNWLYAHFDSKLRTDFQKRDMACRTGNIHSSKEETTQLRKQLLYKILLPLTAGVEGWRTTFKTPSLAQVSQQ